MSQKQFLTGGEAAVMGLKAGGGQIMFGYPITPSTEILHGWIAAAEADPSLSYLQTEDETSAGFGVIGALLAGSKAFTATAGPGNTLMQDPLSMAENLRLPFVAIVMQRGGPSTGTVNYSQQEVFLSAFGGNGDGLRIVYSASTVEEMYILCAKAFSTAWKYRFPTIVLGDGHIAKMRALVEIKPIINPVKASPLLQEKKEPTFLRNCYSSEKEFGSYIKSNISDWNKAKATIEECEQYRTSVATELIIAHGSVADAVKDAIDQMRQKGNKIGLFRPITLHPISSSKLRAIVKKVKKVFILESSLNQLCRLVKYECNGLNTPIIELTKPAESYVSEEISSIINEARKRRLKWIK